MAKILTLEEMTKWISEQRHDNLYTFGFLMEAGRNLPPIKKIWGNYIFENGLSHFPSLRGSGKSLFMLQICAAVSSGVNEFLGEKIELTGKTLYVDFEMPDDFIKRRAAELGVKPSFQLSNFIEHFLVLCTRNSFEKEFPTIVNILNEHQPILMVIDNLKSALKNSDTKSSIDMGNFFSILGGIRERFNCAIVVVDHFRKGTKNQKTDSDLQSGSGTKTDLSDGDFFLRRSDQGDNLRIMKRMKSRMFEESDVTKLVRLNPETLWFDLVDNSVNEFEHIAIGSITDQNELLDLAIELRSQGKSFQQIGAVLTRSKSTISRWFKKLDEK